jgi:hypothetical protein
LKCEGCGVELEENQVNHYQGKVLCEDCTFDLMSPPKVCDPTAVSSTLMVRKQLGQSGTDGLSELQKRIYNMVAERGRISHEALLQELNLAPQVFEREFAVLRHCELLRGFKENGILYFVKY